jgi:hypothetical protein
MEPAAARRLAVPIGIRARAITRAVDVFRRT